MIYFKIILDKRTLWELRKLGGVFDRYFLISVALKGVEAE